MRLLEANAFVLTCKNHTHCNKDPVQLSKWFHCNNQLGNTKIQQVNATYMSDTWQILSWKMETPKSESWLECSYPFRLNLKPSLIHYQERHPTFITISARTGGLPLNLNMCNRNRRGKEDDENPWHEFVGALAFINFGHYGAAASLIVGSGLYIAGSAFA